MATVLRRCLDKMLKKVISLLALVAVATTEEGFHYTRTDGKSVMYKVSNATMTWIDSAKVSRTA